ncbi:MAG: DUF4131 domain-containing protein [Verrucomicrobia bacterium]|nr:DUF4131 domain-containing protein [Verrucomicrobiota bacterium]
MERPFIRPPAPLFFLALSAGLGVAVADAASTPLAVSMGLTTAAFTWGWLCPITGSAMRRLLLGLLVLNSAAGLHYRRHILSPSIFPVPGLMQSTPSAVSLTGRVLTVPDDAKRFRLAVQTSIPSDLLPAGCEMLLHWKGVPPECGDLVRCRAQVQPIAPPRNPGQFNAAQFFMRRNLWMEAVVHRDADGEILLPNTRWQIQTWAARCAQAVSQQLRRGIEDRPQIHALISSMVLGVHAGSLMEMRPWFRDTGTLHLFAVSGLNMTMLAAFLAGLLRIVCVPPRLGALVALPVLLAYGLTTGLGSSCVRALVMSLLILGSEWIRRPAVVLNSLGGAGLLLLFGDGNTLFDGGFQLSFGIVLILALGVRPLTERLHQALEPDCLLPKRLWQPWQKRLLAVGRPVAEALAVSFSAWLAAIPWSIWLFHQLTPVGILANLFAVPIAFVNLALGFLAVFCAPLGPATPALNRANAWVAGRLLDIVQFAEKIPNGHWAVGNPFARQPSLVAFDCGNSGALLLRGSRSRWLLDCATESQARSILIPALQLYGVQELNGLVFSHGDAAYLGGAIEIQAALKPKTVVESCLEDKSVVRKNIRQWFAVQNIPVRSVSAGDILESNEAQTLEVLYPPSGLPLGTAEDKGLVLRLITPHWKVLYTAEAGFPTERWLLANTRSKLHADVWLRGTHTREFTGTDAFVEAVGATLVIVSNSRTHSQRAANQAWARRQRNRGTAVWLQQECGAVEAWETPHLRFRAFLSGEEFPPR